MCCCKNPHFSSHIKAKLVSNSIANQHLTMTVLIEYVNLFTSYMNITLGTYHSVAFILNALTSSKIELKHWAQFYKSHIPLLNVCALATLVTPIYVYSLYLETNLIPYISPSLGHV